MSDWSSLADQPGEERGDQRGDQEQHREGSCKERESWLAETDVLAKQMPIKGSGVAKTINDILTTY